jgi:hypothetical protein
VRHLEQELQEQIEKIGTEKYFSSNAFDRRDSIAALAPEIIKTWEGCTVVASGLSGGQSDLKAFFDAVRPFAAVEIIAEA